jgi:hypothetical protein
MIEHIARYPGLRDRAVFVGNPDDIGPQAFGPGLPAIRGWTEEHYDFAGYVTTLSRPTTSGTGWTGTGPGAAWTSTPPRPR